MKEVVIVDTSSNIMSIVDFNYHKPHQYKSLVDILKHVVEHNTLTITYILQHRQVQVVT